MHLSGVDEPQSRLALIISCCPVKMDDSKATDESSAGLFNSVRVVCTGITGALVSCLVAIIAALAVKRTSGLSCRQPRIVSRVSLCCITSMAEFIALSNICGKSASHDLSLAVIVSSAVKVSMECG